MNTKVSAELWLNIGGRDYRLVGKTIRIGRALDNDIVLEHISASRYHAIITITKDLVIFEDLKSRNGIRVNGRKAKRSELADNDEVQIGDLTGVKFQKTPKSISATSKSGFAPFGLELIHNIIEKIKNKKTESVVSPEQKKKKLMLVSVGFMAVAFLYLIFSGSSEQHAGGTYTKSTAQETKVVEGFADRSKFESCLELEDLGSFREAKTCFKKIPNTGDVATAIARINKIQKRLSETRFKEAKKAFENYYYDIAILKWQEVVLIADDDSEFRSEAVKGIQSAKLRKRQR
jgi:pSer/pThr/pTyr-binding forkhead associated (FHA) protein